MVNSIEYYCKSNSYIYEKKSIVVENIEMTLLQFSIKKLFTRHYSIFIMEENNLDKIESFLKAITNDDQYSREHILLICSTQLTLDKDKYCVYSNNNQFVDCVYYNTLSQQYNYYTDMDTPKCFKELITYLVKNNPER